MECANKNKQAHLLLFCVYICKDAQIVPITLRFGKFKGVCLIVGFKCSIVTLESIDLNLFLAKKQDIIILTKD